MKKSRETYLLSGLAMLSGRRGGIAEVLEVIQAPEYDEIRLWAFYAPAVALVLFSIFAVTLITKTKVAIPISIVCFAFSAWSLTEISTIGWFGIIVSGWYLGNVYKESKLART